MMPFFMETAILMVDFGGYVFPVNGKQPNVPQGVSWKEFATNDREKVIPLLTRGRTTGYGVWGGTGDGLMMIDDDRRGEGFQRFHDEHIARSYLDSRTFTVQTPKQGFHFYYLVTAAQRAAIGDTHALKAYGIDVKASGYVVGPSSMHPEGGRYKILGTTAIAPLPDDMYQAILSLAQPQKNKTSAPTLQVGAAVDGRDAAYTRGVVDGIIRDLRAAPSTPGVEPRWQQLCFSKACKLVELANSGRGLTHEQALLIFMENAPEDRNHGRKQLAHYWRSAIAHVGGRALTLPTGSENTTRVGE